MGYIYIIKNKVNNKVYIGQTRLSVEKRFNDHLRNCKSGSTKLYTEMRELGVDKFYYDIIEECNNKNLNDREIFYIKEYDSINNGYNHTRGGDVDLEEAYSIEELQDMADSGMALIDIVKETGITLGFLTHHIHTNGNGNVTGNNIKVPIDMYDENYNFITSFDSYVDTINYLNAENKNNTRNIFNCIKQSCMLGNTYHGYRFRFKGENFEEAIRLQEEKQKRKEEKSEAIRGKKEDLANEMYTMKQNGISYSEIGNKFNMSSDSVRMYINRHSTLKKIKSNDFKVKALDMNKSEVFECNTFLDAAKIICEMCEFKSPKNVAYRISKAVESGEIYNGYYWLKVYNKKEEEII